MRPNLNMMSKLVADEQPAPLAPLAPASGARRIAELNTQRDNIALALKETRDARKSMTFQTAIDQNVKALRDAGVGPPDAGPVGVISVRIVGLIKQNKTTESVPLAKVSVQLKVEGKEVATDSTDAFGIVILELPDRKPVAYELDVIGGACEVVQCERAKPPADRGAVHVVQIAETPSLAGAFEAAKPWIAAGLAAGTKAAELKDTITKALDGQEKELVALLAETDQALASCDGRSNPPPQAQAKGPAAESRTTGEVTDERNH